MDYFLLRGSIQSSDSLCHGFPSCLKLTGKNQFFGTGDIGFSLTAGRLIAQLSSPGSARLFLG
jgi:hypothetical protein